MLKISISPDDRNADWLKTIVNPTTGKTYREEELAIHDALTKQTVIKHFPGEHNQLDHGRRSGASHATVSRDWLSNQHVLTGDYGKPGSAQDDLSDTLSQYDVSQEDLAGLRSITDAPPDGYHYVNGVLRKIAGAGLLAGDIQGVYNPKTTTLHISPTILATESGKKTLLHEIGHHVSQKHAEDEAAYVAWERILKEAPTHIEGTEFVRDTSELQRKYGLRERSLDGTDELLADSYMASKMGSKAQKVALEALWQDAGTPLQEMLKHLPGRHDQHTHAPKSAMNDWVLGQQTSPEDTKAIDEAAADHVSAAAKLYRVQAQDFGTIIPEVDGPYLQPYEVGDVMHFDGPTSFTRSNILEGGSAGSIGVKYSDSAVIVLSNKGKKLTGMDIDYSETEGWKVGAGAEQETIVPSSTNYAVRRVREIDHPAAAFGKLMVYYLEQLPEPTYKELSGLVSVTELSPIKDDDQIAIVGVPVEVSAELVRATPWYYLESGVVLKHLPGRHDQHSHGRIRKLGKSPTGKEPTNPLSDPDSAENTEARANWKNLSHEQKMALLDPNAINESMARTLGKYRETASFLYQFEEGQATDATYVGQMKGNAFSYLKTLEPALTPGTRKRMAEYIDMYSKALKEAVDDGSLPKGVKAADVNEMMLDNVDKMVFQESETRKRQLGDHGIRHVTGNIENAHKMQDQLEGTTGFDKLLAAQVMVDHDMGYTAGVVQKSFEATKYHELFSEKYARSEDEQYRKVFGDRTDELYGAIATHADFDLDWKNQPTLSAIRTADNLALFSRDKLPALFMDVPGATTTLYKLQLAKSVGQDAEMLPKVKEELGRLIDNTSLDARVKAELHSAAEEVMPLTGKFTLGMLAGEIDDFSFDGEKMDVGLVNKPEREVLNGLFDLGDRQFEKFLENYNQEGAAGDEGVDLLEKASGQRVLKVKFKDQDTTVANRELVELNDVSVRPIIHKVVGALGENPDTELRDKVWKNLEKPLSERLTKKELADFRKRYYGTDLLGFPLSAKEKAYLETEWKEKHLAGRHDQKSHAPKSAGVAGKFANTFNTLTDKLSIKSPGPEDIFLKSMLHDVGYDVLPKKVSKEELNDLIASGATELFRGFGAEDEHIEQFVGGELFVGKGPHGNGISTTKNENEASGYGKHLRMALDKSAKVITNYDVGLMLESEKLPEQVRIDKGRIATYLGYDAIDAGRHVVVLDRGKLFVQDDSDIVEKHLPGRHPQTSHTPRLYIGGNPITFDYFDDGGSKLIQNLSRDMQQTVMEACVNYKITEEELTDLAGFSMAPDSGYALSEQGYFYYKADPDEEVLGLYNPDTKVVSIAPALAGRTDGPKVVLHEVGHHVARQNPKYKNRRAAAGFVLSQLRHKGVGPVEAVDYGLREYSFSSENEFMADTYLCLKAGNEIQRRNLNDAYAEIGYEEGMAGVLKELWAIKHLAGRHDQRTHGRIKRSNPYATGAAVVDSYSKLAPITGSNVHSGKGYFILANDNLLDMKNESHLQAYVDYDASKYLGIPEKETEHAIEVYEKDENFPINEFAKLHDEVMGAGNIRVRETRGFVNVETKVVDNSTLRRLQKLYDTGKLGISPNQSVFWDDPTAENSLRIHDMQDFLDAKSVADLKRRTQFKQVLHADELISFEKANIVQTVSVPVVIGDRQASETPWYYTNVRAEEKLVKLAGLLGRWKHLPGRHDQKTHSPKTFSHIEMAPDWVPEIGKYRQQAKERIAEWKANGMSDFDIAIDAYRWREFAGRYGQDTDYRESAGWNWAMYEQTQEIAKKIGYKLKKKLTAKDVFDDPDLPADLLEFSTDKEYWKHVEHQADDWNTKWRNVGTSGESTSRTAMGRWLNSEEGKAYQDRSIKELWYSSRKVGTKEIPGGKGYGASRHFDKYRPYAGMEELVAAKNFQEAKDATVEVYRGVERNEYATENRNAPFISYTTSPEIAKLFAEGYAHSYNVPGQGMVLKRRIKASEIMGFVNNDGELEVLVKPPKTKTREKELDVVIKLDSELEVAYKHLAGRHDQKSHGRSYSVPTFNPKVSVDGVTTNKEFALAQLESYKEQIPEHILLESSIRSMEVFENAEDAAARIAELEGMPAEEVEDVRGAYDRDSGKAIVSLYMEEDSFLPMVGPTGVGYNPNEGNYSGRNYYHEFAHSLEGRITSDDWERAWGEWEYNQDEGFARAFSGYMVAKRSYNTSGSSEEMDWFKENYPITHEVFTSWHL